MLYLYLDESGDLGFDFVNKKPSNYFSICVLALKGRDNDRAMSKAIKAVARRKLRATTTGSPVELKGIKTDIEVKRFLYKKVSHLPFRLYALTLDKRISYPHLATDKERIYNYIARLTLEQVDFRDAAVRVIITVDRSKGAAEIHRFNNYVLSQIKARLDPRVPLEIYHASSQQNYGLQAVDMFAWGVFRKYEAGDTEWYDVFREKLGYERLYHT